MGNCHPEKTNFDRGEAEAYIGFRGVTISHVTLSCSQYLLYNTECYLIIRYMHRLHYVCFQNNPGQVNVGVCVSYSVNSNAHTTPVRIYGEPYAHKFSAVDIFLEYHPSSSNITRCQVPSRVRAWFHDSAGDIDFYPMSLTQSECYYNDDLKQNAFGNIGCKKNCDSAYSISLC